MPPAPSGPTPSPCRLSTRPPGSSDVERAAGWTSSAPCCVAPGCCQSQGRGGTLDHCRRRPCLLLFLLPAFLEAAEVSLRDFFIASAYVVSLRAEVPLTSVCRRMHCLCESEGGGETFHLFPSSCHATTGSNVSATRCGGDFPPTNVRTRVAHVESSFESPPFIAPLLFFREGRNDSCDRTYAQAGPYLCVQQNLLEIKHVSGSIRSCLFAQSAASFVAPTYTEPYTTSYSILQDCATALREAAPFPPLPNAPLKAGAPSGDFWVKSKGVGALASWDHLLAGLNSPSSLLQGCG